MKKNKVCKTPPIKQLVHFTTKNSLLAVACPWCLNLILDQQYHCSRAFLHGTITKKFGTVQETPGQLNSMTRLTLKSYKSKDIAAN